MKSTRDDYYVAVKIDAIDVDGEQKPVDWEHISTATIWGYAEHSYMQRSAKVANFGRDRQDGCIIIDYWG